MGRRIKAFAGALLGVTLMAVSSAPATVAAPSASGARRAAAGPIYSASNPIPWRRQWNENHGYCGEVSFISAGLYYGQYLSQYDARAIASNDTPQHERSSQLLLGVNAGYAASQMHLSYARWTPGPGSTASSFLQWVKSEVIKGYPVAIGIYTNEFLFYGSTNPTAGSAHYDHIVDVTGIASSHPLALPATYYPTDVLTFSDNHLWTGSAQQNIFSYSFGSFQATRQQANAQTSPKRGPIYSLADVRRDYGIALTGILDQDHETVPVRVATSVNYERPEIRHHSDARPSPMPLTLTVTVSGLQTGRTYNLYRYNSMSSVPNTAFNQNQSAASQSWTFTATGPTYTLTQPIESNDEVIYRAVPASAS